MFASRLGLLALWLLGPVMAVAEDMPASRSTTDRQIIDTLGKVHDRGAALFNAGDHGGCYRLFQGTLQTVRLVLPRDLQDQVDAGLARAEREVDLGRRAMVL